jgi:hypothetical protein
MHHGPLKLLLPIHSPLSWFGVSGSPASVRCPVMKLKIKTVPAGIGPLSENASPYLHLLSPHPHLSASR